MAGLNIISLSINNIPISIKPNSFKMKAGRGDRTLRTKANGRNTSTVLTIDQETEKGMFAFTLVSETDTMTQVVGWQDNLDANRGVATDSAGNSYTFNKAVILTDPEVVAAVDGETEIEFESQQMVLGQ